MDEKEKEFIKKSAVKEDTRSKKINLRGLFRRKKRNQEEPRDEQPKRWVQIRLIPIWLRILIVLLLLVGAILLGAYIGYSVIGDESPADIFKKETWLHITNIIKGVEE